MKKFKYIFLDTTSIEKEVIGNEQKSLDIKERSDRTAYVGRKRRKISEDSDVISDSTYHHQPKGKNNKKEKNRQAAIE